MSSKYLETTLVTTHEKGLSSILLQTASDIDPPRFVTLNISRNAARGSGKNMTPSLQTTASNDSVLNGNESAGHCWNETFPSLRRCPSVLDAATISATASVQTTQPIDPTTSAIVNDGSPEPPATSSTELPGTMSAPLIST